MKTKTVDSAGIRNIAVAGHGGCGKTSLVEAMLFNTGVIDRLGRVEDGSTTSDFDPEEVRRHISINASIAPAPWKDGRLNLLDTPGFADFVGDVKGAMRVVESCLVVVCAVSGVEVGTESVWNMAAGSGLARIICVNKMDRENADFAQVLSQLTSAFGDNVVPLQLPIGSESSFKGVVDLLQMKALVKTGEKTVAAQEIPAELADDAALYRDKLVELAAEGDDDILVKYLEGEELTQDEIVTGIRNRVSDGSIYPVLCGSAHTGVGVQQLLDMLTLVAPAPGTGVAGKDPRTGEKVELPAGSLAALVFKTVADPYVGKLTYFRVFSGEFKSDSHVINAGRDNTDERVGQVFHIIGKKQEPADAIRSGDIGAVAKLQVTETGDTLSSREKPVVLEGISFPAPIMSAAVTAKTKGDEDKMGAALQRMVDEDPTMDVRRDTETGETIVSGMGEAHIDIVVERLKRKFGVDVVVSVPRIPYRETINGTAKADYKHKKQSGGRGQYGHCVIEISPMPRGEGFVFEDKIFGGSIPRQYIPAVEKGVREAMQEGILAGNKVIDVKVTLLDGSFHPVDSSEMAFKIAGSMAFKKGCADASPVLLEPMVNMEINVPEANTGDVISDMNSKRGRILGMEPQGNGRTIVKAVAPLAEVQRYSIDLTSITQGRGIFSMEASNYEEVPAHTAEKILAEAAREKKE